jgi:hypothetical protein
MTSSNWLGLGARRPLAVANGDVGRPVAADVDVDDDWQRLGSGGLRVTRRRRKRSVDQTLSNILPPWTIIGLPPGRALKIQWYSGIGSNIQDDRAPCVDRSSA